MSKHDTDTALRALIDNISDALRRRDAKAIVAHYAPDALLFDLAPPLSHHIKVADLAAWLDTWEGPVTREVRDLEITIDGNLAVAHGFFRTSAVTKQGRQQAAWWSRATLTFARKDDQWLIVHEHTSVPFYMDGSFRAAVDLQP